MAWRTPPSAIGRALLEGIRRAFLALGPGFVGGASDSDPTSVGSFILAGAATGFGLLWVPLVLLPLLWAVAFLCTKIGLAAHKGLAQALRQRFGVRWLLPVVAALVVSNVITAWADLGAAAAGVSLLTGIPAIFVVFPLAFVILGFQFLGSFKQVEGILKVLTLTLLAYVVAAFPAHPDWGAVVSGTFHPAFRATRAYWLMAIALLGTTLSPYVFFWQASEEVEESQASPQIATRRHAMGFAAWDVGSGMVMMSLVSYFISLTTGATLHGAGQRSVQTVAEAARALVPLVGPWSGRLLAIGLIGSGMLAVPVISTSSGFAVAEAMGWPRGLADRPRAAIGFYSVIAASTLIGAAMNFMRVGALEALFWASALNAFLAPPVLLAILAINRDRRLMGASAGGAVETTLTWLALAATVAAAIGLVWGLV